MKISDSIAIVLYVKLMVVTSNLITIQTGCIPTAYYFTVAKQLTNTGTFKQQLKLFYLKRAFS